MLYQLMPRASLLQKLFLITKAYCVQKNKCKEVLIEVVLDEPIGTPSGSVERAQEKKSEINAVDHWQVVSYCQPDGYDENWQFTKLEAYLSRLSNHKKAAKSNISSAKSR